MIRKRVSLDSGSNNFLDRRIKNNDKENINPSLNISEKQFKTPEKNHQITIENNNTTVTITNYFHQCKSSYQRENFPLNKPNYDYKGLEKKLSFDGLKDSIFTLQKKAKYTSNSPKEKSHLSITFSDLKKNGFNLNKRFNSIKKYSVDKKEIFSKNSKGSTFSCKADISSDSLYMDEVINNRSEKDYSQQESDASVDSNLCCHNTIPYNRINDENFKIIALKKLRKIEIPHIKSVNCKYYEYKRRPIDYDGNITKFFEFHNLKRRKVTSHRKIYQGYGEFKDQETEKKMVFCFYGDKEVGFSSEWQKKLRVSEMDDDVKTDDEQLILAKKHIFKELKEGFIQFNKKKVHRKISLM